jgi:hypothetical protein
MPAKTLSGAGWVARFPTSTSTTDLVEPFKTNVASFIAAMQGAGATVSIGATLRPKQRAYLMHWSFRIAKQGYDPAKVPAMTGVDIEWVHRNLAGHVDLKASRSAASDMVSGYGIVYRPALSSRHTEGKAIDMTIVWSAAELKITPPKGTAVSIKSKPRDGGNTELHKVGKSFGVIKHVSDPPHWSSDGH